MDDMTFNLIEAAANRVVNDIQQHEFGHYNPTFREQIIEMGFTRIGHGEEHGGLGLDLRQQCVINNIFGRTRLHFRNTFGYTSSLAAYMIDQFGDNVQRTNLLEEINLGTMISFALTEPAGGSKIIDMATSYKENFGEYRVTGCGEYTLTGSKQFITNSDTAAFFIVFARNGKSISAFLVDRDNVEIIMQDDSGVFKGINTSSIYFDDAPAELLGEEGKGLRMAMQTLERSRVIISAAACGMAGRALFETAKYTKDRKLSQHQLIQAKLANCYTDLYAAESMVADASSSEHDDDFAIKSSATKLYCSQMVNRVLDDCVQMFGGAGLMYHNIVEEFYRDARAFRIFEGTDEMQQLAIAKLMMKRLQ